MRPAIFSPSATTTAPVSVATSTIASAPSSTASDERVGENEPAFGVGVQHLDGLAVADGQHVAGPHGSAARHVLHERHVGHHTCLDPEIAQRRHGGDHRRGARHVGLHRFHAAGRLERQTAGVEHDTLADERERRLGAARRVLEPHEARRSFGAVPDAEHAAHPFAFELFACEHLDLQPRRAPDGAGELGDVGR